MGIGEGVPHALGCVGLHKPLGLGRQKGGLADVFVNSLSRGFVDLLVGCCVFATYPLRQSGRRYAEFPRHLCLGNPQFFEGFFCHLVQIFFVPRPLRLKQWRLRVHFFEPSAYVLFKFFSFSLCDRVIRCFWLIEKRANDLGMRWAAAL